MDSIKYPTKINNNKITFTETSIMISLYKVVVRSMFDPTNQ